MDITGDRNMENRHSLILTDFLGSNPFFFRWLKLSVYRTKKRNPAFLIEFWESSVREKSGFLGCQNLVSDVRFTSPILHLGDFSDNILPSP